MHNFKRVPGLDKNTFDIKREAMNRKLKRIFKDRFVTFNTIQYPKDYNDDLVHFGSGGEKKGLKKYFFKNNHNENSEMARRRSSMLRARKGRSGHFMIFIFIIFISS